MFLIWWFQIANATPKFKFCSILLYLPADTNISTLLIILPPTISRSRIDSRLIVSHVTGSGAELGVGLNDFVDGFKEVLLGCNLPASANSKHSSLGANRSNLSSYHCINARHWHCMRPHKNYDIQKHDILPVLLGHSRASSSKRISLSTLIDLAWILKIWVRPSRSGRPNSTFLSKRPGLIRAGSKVSGLLVAIRTYQGQQDYSESLPLVKMENYRVFNDVNVLWICELLRKHVRVAPKNFRKNENLGFPHFEWRHHDQHIQF